MCYWRQLFKSGQAGLWSCSGSSVLPERQASRNERHEYGSEKPVAAAADVPGRGARHLPPGVRGGGAVQPGHQPADARLALVHADRKSTRLNSSHANISYAVFCLKKKKITNIHSAQFLY